MDKVLKALGSLHCLGGITDGEASLDDEATLLASASLHFVYKMDKGLYHCLQCKDPIRFSFENLKAMLKALIHFVNKM